MAYSEMTQAAWLQRASRVLLHGETGARKTTSLLTWERPCHVLVFPGEKGSTAIAPEDGLTIHTFEDVGEHSEKVVREVEALTTAIIRGDKGPVRTIAGDGLHKLNEYHMDVATGGAFFQGGEFAPTLWGVGRRSFIKYVGLVYQNSVANVVLTCWSAQEKDDPNNRSRDAKTRLWPDLPGQLARRILGEFTAVLHARVIKHPKTGEPVYVWQAQPDDEVGGVGIKAPLSVASRIPKYLPQNYAQFQRLLLALDRPGLESHKEAVTLEERETQ